MYVYIGKYVHEPFIRLWFHSLSEAFRVQILVYAYIGIYTSFEFNFRFVGSLIKQDNTEVGLGTSQDIGDEKQNE